MKVPVPESSPANESDPPPRARSFRWVSIIVTLVLAVALFWLGRRVVAEQCWRRAAVAIDRGTLADALPWLDRGQRLAPASPQGPLLRARLHRQRGDQEGWESAIASLGDLEMTRSDGQTLRLERRLGKIRWDEEPAVTEEELDRLVRDGADVDDTAMTLLARLVEAEEFEHAEALLGQWEVSTPPPAQLAWGRGLYRDHAGDHESSRGHFEDALAIAPRHDNARLGLAEATKELREYASAAKRFAEHLRLWPQSEAALLGWSHCARQLGQIELADELIQHAIEHQPSFGVWMEAAEVAFLLGDYEEAYRRFEQTDLEGAQRAITIRTAATAGGLAGRPDVARSLFDRYLMGHHQTFRREALESRVREDPSDQQAMEELRRIMAGQYEPVGFPDDSGPAISPLFSQHCAACHGESGRGNGRANRHLWPPSRDLRGDTYRLVTTTNGFPSRDDIRAVIRNGIPGTAMPAFAELSEEQIEQLVEVTYSLRQEGFREGLVASFEAFDEPLEDDVIAEIMERRGSAGPAVAVPDWPSDTDEQRVAGRELYERATCNRCHGEDGRGARGLMLLDDRGQRTAPRDLVADPMKGGSDRSALFARLRLGMPGTPHPANPTLSDQELISLVEYSLSLGQEPKRQLTNHERAVRANLQDFAR